MRSILFFQYIFMVVFVLTLYYVLGGNVFPDYFAYTNIAYNDFGREGGYFTEFFSRYILYDGLIDEINRVDQLVVFIQFFFVTSTLLAIFKNSKDIYIVIVFVAFFSPLLLTTVLRASPLYVMFFLMSIYYFKHKVTFLNVVFLCIFGSLFHDSFLIITIALLGVWFTQFFNIKLGRTTLVYILLLSFMLVFLAPAVLPVVISLLDFSVLGARSVYMSDSGFSGLKLIVLIILNALSFYFVRFESGTYNQKVTLTILVFLTNVIFAFGSTAGIRFSVFPFAYLFVVRGCFLFNFEAISLSNQVISGAFLFLVFIIRFYSLI